MLCHLGALIILVISIWSEFVSIYRYSNSVNRSIFGHPFAVDLGNYDCFVRAALYFWFTTTALTNNRKLYIPPTEGSSAFFRKY